MDFTSFIRDIPDFPKPGVMFRDISPLLKNPQALQKMVEAFSARMDLSSVDAFVGIESRGFILASMMAMHTQKGFIPLRKAGKLPPHVFRESYTLEYGEATLEMAQGHGRVIIMDDVLATGGTLAAGISLCQKAGYEIQDVAVLIDLPFLNDFRFQGRKVVSLVQYK
jgi:adenine phosphoribosyltransferase